MKVLKKGVIPAVPKTKLFKGACLCGCEVEVTEQEVTEYIHHIRGPSDYLWTKELCPTCRVSQIQVTEVKK